MAAALAEKAVELGVVAGVVAVKVGNAVVDDNDDDDNGDDDNDAVVVGADDKDEAGVEDKPRMLVEGAAKELIPLNDDPSKDRPEERVAEGGMMEEPKGEVAEREVIKGGSSCNRSSSAAVSSKSVMLRLAPEPRPKRELPKEEEVEVEEEPKPVARVALAAGATDGGIEVVADESGVVVFVASTGVAAATWISSTCELAAPIISTSAGSDVFTSRFCCSRACRKRACSASRFLRASSCRSERGAVAVEGVVPRAAGRRALADRAPLLVADCWRICAISAYTSWRILSSSSSRACSSGLSDTADTLAFSALKDAVLTR